MTFRAEVVSPEKRCIDRDVDMVIVPGTEGDIAAMPGRSPLMLRLRPGIIRLKKDGKLIERVFVSGGFVEMTSDHCTILADSVRALSELSRQDAEERLQNLEQDYANIHVADDSYVAATRETLQYKIDSVKAELRIIESLHKES